jgi:hypothetical protein
MTKREQHCNCLSIIYDEMHGVEFFNLFTVTVNSKI